MVIYAERDSLLRADYFDNEGHVIHYAVQIPSPGKAIFTGDDSAPGPRYRLSHVLRSPDELDGKFEIAPPSNPSAFKTYLEWTTAKTPNK